MCIWDQLSEYELSPNDYLLRYAHSATPEEWHDFDYLADVGTISRDWNFALWPMAPRRITVWPRSMTGNGKGKRIFLGELLCNRLPITDSQLKFSSRSTPLRLCRRAHRNTGRRDVFFYSSQWCFGDAELAP